MVFRDADRNPINGQKKGGVKARTIKKTDKDVPVFVNITDAADCVHEILRKINLASGFYVSFEMGCVDYEERGRFSTQDIY